MNKEKGKIKKSFVNRCVDTKIVRYLLSSPTIDNINNRIKPYLKKIFASIGIVSFISEVPVMILYIFILIPGIFMMKELTLSFVIFLLTFLIWGILFFIKIMLINLRKETIPCVIIWFSTQIILTIIVILISICSISGLINIYSYQELILLYDITNVLPFLGLSFETGHIVRILGLQILNLILISIIFILTLKNRDLFQKKLF